jgi:hypothetical protein
VAAPPRQAAQLIAMQTHGRGTPTSRAMASAVSGWSPVIIMTYRRAAQQRSSTRQQWKGVKAGYSRGNVGASESGRRGLQGGAGGDGVQKSPVIIITWMPAVLHSWMAWGTPVIGGGKEAMAMQHQHRTPAGASADVGVGCMQGSRAAVRGPLPRSNVMNGVHTAASWSKNGASTSS